MTIENGEHTQTVADSALPQSDIRGILSYFFLILLLSNFGGPNTGFVDVALSYFLKDNLHFTATQTAEFRLITALPFYFSFLFGLVRDVWSPFRLKDRGYFIVFGLVGSASYGLVALMPYSSGALLWGMLLVSVAFLFVASAWHGLIATLGQQHLMAGWVSAAWQIFGSVIILVSMLAGGIFSDFAHSQSGSRGATMLLMIGATAMLLVAAFGLWRPRSVYDNLHNEPDVARNVLADLRRLASHWPIYPALVIWLAWNFAPGTQTVLQYYLSDKLLAKDIAWGAYNAINVLAFIPTFLLFGFLSRRYSLRSLLWWGAAAGVPQMLPLIFINSATGALIAAVPIGLMGGMAEAAFLALLIRSCPRGLQGSFMMLASSVALLAGRVGNVFGANIYEHDGGFLKCALASTLVYAMILPVLLLVPKSITEPRDAEPRPS